MQRCGLVLLSALFFSTSACSDDSTSKPDSAVIDRGPGVDGAAIKDAGPADGHDMSPPPADKGPLDITLPDGDGPVIPACIEATGQTELSGKINDSSGNADVTRGGVGCLYSYTIETTAPLRDNEPQNPRTVNELADWPTVRSRNMMFDALYALALEETRENSVSSIQDHAFNNGQPLPCPTGGCFETGRLWKYVWTRDTAYAVDLGLGSLDPIRAKNSLSFKTSEKRTGGGRQVMQDTGTGGSYPISSDRVVWSIGARKLLHFLSGSARSEFASLALEAMRNTAEHDRKVVYDPQDGLYRGEQSFLDWREQSYPYWVKDNPIHVGMSKSLSTNVGHYVLLDTTAKLAAAAGDSQAATRYSGWASALKTAIDSRLYQSDAKLYAAFIPTHFDQAPNHQYDLLGSALAILEGIPSAQRAKDIVANYPHVGMGAPVLWPQQKQVPIYHNRALWPFVTAYWLRAAARVRNDKAVNLAVRSMIRGSALNLSNMENFEFISGKPWEDDPDKSKSGPVINSQRQLWSVAGYLSLVHDVFFGMRTQDDAIDFQPYITRALRAELFSAADSIVLNNFPYHGKTITVVVKLPKAQSGQTDGAYAISGRSLNGVPLPAGFIPAASLRARNLLEIELVDTPEAASSINLISNVSDPKAIYGPLPPNITSVALDNGKIKVDFDAGGESSADIAFNIYRDGQKIGSNVSGQDRSYVDPNSSSSSASHCYVVESFYKSSKNHSQHSEPICFWGQSFERVISFTADKLKNTGGQASTNHGRYHYEVWGDPGHELELSSFKPSQSGRYLLQVSYGNGSGSGSSGITCAVKNIEVFEGSTSVGQGELMMPQIGDWAAWRDSSMVAVTLAANKDYRIVISESSVSHNMSVFDHFSSYNGEGGKSGTFNRVNISHIKILYLGK
jgi:hypothetical protein